MYIGHFSYKHFNSTYIIIIFFDTTCLDSPKVFTVLHNLFHQLNGEVCRELVLTLLSDFITVVWPSVCSRSSSQRKT